MQNAKATLHEETPEPRPLKPQEHRSAQPRRAPHKPLKTHKSVLSQFRESVSLGSGAWSASTARVPQLEEADSGRSQPHG